MTRHTTRAVLGAGALARHRRRSSSRGCGGSGFDDTGDGGGGGDGGELTSSDDALTILIGSSGEAETEAVEDAVAAWSEESGVEADGPGRQRPDPAAVAGLRGRLTAGPVLPRRRRRSPATPATDRSRPTATCSRTRTTSTRRSSRTSPSTASSTARRRTSRRSRSIINKGLWEAAGLTDDDIPTTWDELADGQRRR